jgi:fido (protein-threonine AMPylation protein)
VAKSLKISPGQRQFADALQALKKLQDAGKAVLKSEDLARPQREALVKNGFLRQIIKGWYMPCRPDERPGDTTSWYAVLRNFVREYCDDRFGELWHASPEYSVALQVGNTVSPRQVIVWSPKAANRVQPLPDGFSLLDYRREVAASRTETTLGVRVMPLSLALIKLPEAFYRNSDQDAQIALHQVDASDLVRDLVEGGHSALAGRLAGAMRAVGRTQVAEEIVSTMRSVGYSVSETNPFERPLPDLQFVHARSPYVLRMRLMWHEMREVVLRTFPVGDGRPTDVDAFMDEIEEAYVSDAYHSLSIEGYRVSDDLIRRVATGDWSPETEQADSEAKNALAARGYWLAHNKVKETIVKMFSGANPGEAFRADHAGWFQNMWQPCVAAGILKPVDLAGYRSHPVFIKNATHVPPSKEAVRDMMPELCSLLEAEESAAVRAVLGHFMFVYIHPYMDGNGRIGRFLMNAMLTSGGYPWTVIRVERRAEYLAALDAASARGDIGPLTSFICSCLEENRKIGIVRG